MISILNRLICAATVIFGGLLINAGGNPYHRLYTREIYNQKDFVSALKCNDGESESDYNERLEGQLVENFIARKRQHIDTRVAHSLEQKIEIIKKKKQNYRQAIDQKAAAEALGFWVKLGNAVGMIAEGKIGSGVATLLAKGGDAISKQLDDAILEIEKSGQNDLLIADLQVERERLLEGVTTEVWHELELEYIKRKRFMKEALCNSVENKFLTARAVDGTLSELYRSFFNNALLLPVSSKKLGTQEVRDDVQATTVDDCVKNVVKRLERDSSFANYDSTVQDALKELAIKLVYLSHLGEAQKPYLRRGCYFWGKPFTGKSNAAELLQRVLCLPACEKRLYSAEDLSKNNLEGGSFWSPQVNIGWIAEALTSKAPDGKTYNNIILIINEIDRVFSGTNKVPEAFLLDILDPGKKEIISPYFGNIPIDISRLIIIGTGNSPIFLPGDAVPIPRKLTLRSQTLMQNGIPLLAYILLLYAFHEYIPVTELIPLSSLDNMTASGLLALLPVLLVYEFIKRLVVFKDKVSLPQKSTKGSSITLSDPDALKRRLQQIEFPEFLQQEKGSNARAAILQGELNRLVKFYSVQLEDAKKEEFIKQALTKKSMAEAILDLGAQVHEYKMLELHSAGIAPMQIPPAAEIRRRRAKKGLRAQSS